MLGVPASGKTSFMAALNDSLVFNSFADFQIKPSGFEIDENVIPKGQWETLSKGEFPAATNSTTLWSFDLRYKDKFLSSFKMIDYRGELLFENLTTDSSRNNDLSELLAFVMISNAVIIFADSQSITNPSIKKARSLSGVNAISQILGKFQESYPDTNLVLLIALTKVDMLENKWKENDYESLINQGLIVFDPIVNLCKQNKSWSSGIIPVSAVGEGNAQTFREFDGSISPKITNLPKPINVEQALFFCLGKTLKQRQQAIQKDLLISYNKESIKKSSLLVKLWSFLVAKPTPENILESIKEQQQSDYLAYRQYEASIEPFFERAARRVKAIS
ncbi:MAG: hypothetical protein L6Q45_12670 [Anaerolineales bacterium]|nr:hypothetical protein [Anaerolineales bacterium]